jgi:BioD-like phosphotransacetylase family protein
MMTTPIYVTSTQDFSGKSAMCVGLLRRCHNEGLAIGYMKPVSTTARIVGEQVIDEDALFIKSTFDLAESLSIMTPVILTDKRIADILSGNEEDFMAQVQSAYNTIIQGKDVVVMEGGGDLREGWIVNLAPPHVSELLAARELVVVPYRDDLQVVDDLITAKVRLGESLLGGVVNSVPKHRLDFVEKQIKPFTERRGVPLFAILPRERLLLSTSVQELREGLNGEVLCAHHALGELVENLMVGAMSADSALTYFRRKANKAVITGGDRSDIQLAALETSTKCLILTGNLRPSPLIIGRAEELGIPIILTRHDTITVVEIIETFFGKTRFHQTKKVEHFESLLSKHMDFNRLFKTLGLR